MKKNGDQNKTLLTTAEVAELLGLNPRTVRSYAKRGLLQPKLARRGWCLRFLFLGSDVARFLDDLPTLAALRDPTNFASRELCEIRRLLDRRRVQVAQATEAANRARDQGRTEIVNPEADSR